MPPSSGDLRRARPLLGTIVELTVRGLSESAALQATNAAFACLEEVEGRMSFHDPESMLSALNRGAFRGAIAVDAWTYQVLEAAQELWRISGGAFDVSIAPRLQTLGFLPTASASDGLDHGADFGGVELLPERCVRFRTPNVRLDLGGIAKGFAVDRALETLREHGVPSALVNAGGDLRALGLAAFPIHIRHPREPGRLLTEVALADTALATSAHYFADRLVAGSEFGPIVEPSAGNFATGVLSATVRAETALLADALTKIVMLRGEAALPILEHFRADAIFVASSGDVLCSPHWHAAFHLST